MGWAYRLEMHTYSPYIYEEESPTSYPFDGEGNQADERGTFFALDRTILASDLFCALQLFTHRFILLGAYIRLGEPEKRLWEDTERYVSACKYNQLDNSHPLPSSSLLDVHTISRHLHDPIRPNLFHAGSNIHEIYISATIAAARLFSNLSQLKSARNRLQMSSNDAGKLENFYMRKKSKVWTRFELARANPTDAWMESNSFLLICPLNRSGTAPARGRECYFYP